MALRGNYRVEVVRIEGQRVALRATLREGNNLIEDFGTFIIAPGAFVAVECRIDPKMKLPAYLMEE